MSRLPMHTQGSTRTTLRTQGMRCRPTPIPRMAMGQAMGRSTGSRRSSAGAHRHPWARQQAQEWAPGLPQANRLGRGRHQGHPPWLRSLPMEGP